MPPTLTAAAYGESQIVIHNVWVKWLVTSQWFADGESHTNCADTARPAKRIGLKNSAGIILAEFPESNDTLECAKLKVTSFSSTALNVPEWF